MKKIIYWIKKKYLIVLPFLLLIIFIISMWDRNFHIGGDNVLPLNPLNNIEKSIYVWESLNQGISQWKYTYLLWQLPFYFFSFLGIPPFAGIKIFIAGILVIGFVFTYLFFRALFKGSRYDGKNLALFCGFIFILSASQLHILPTLIFLSALPLSSYFVIKYLDTGKFWHVLLFAITINYAYLGHLPQAKFIFIFSGNLLFVLLLYKQLRNISCGKIILKLLILSFFTFLLNAFILIPFLYEAFKVGGTYSYYTKNVTVYNGEGDVPTASLPYITRFFPSSLIDPVSSFGRFLGGSLFTIWTFILWIIAFLSVFFVKERKEKRIIFLLFLGSALYIFIAKGANPPFGEIYKFLLFNVPVFKIFRTTATTVIGGTLLFATLVTISMYYLANKRQFFFALILFIHIAIFSPVYLGYRLITFDEKGQIRKGFSIPDEYYQMGDKLDKIKEDLKILSLPLDDGYSYKDWPYMGQSIMAWMTKKPFIHGQIAGFSGFTDNLVLQRMTATESCYWIAVNNIGFILKEKDSRIPDYSLSEFNFSGSTVLENPYFKLEKVNPECFLPHIYVATDVFSFEGEKNSIPDVSRFIKDKQDMVIGLNDPVNKKKNLQAVSQIIEAYPEETSNLSDNNVTKKVFSDLSGSDPLNFWTYTFTVPTEGNYQMVVDSNGMTKRETKFLAEGENTVQIPILKSKNLLDENPTTYPQALKDLEGDNLYLISLQYYSEGPSNLLFTLEERDRHFAGRLPSYDLNAVINSQEMIRSRQGVYQYQAIFKTDINVLEATVTLKKLFGDIIVESFRIEKVTPPKIFFIILKDEKKTIPEISFQKINPTKYLIEVKNATESYNLVFSESFSPDWKAYLQLEPIAEGQHSAVNGFANGWKITPKDSKGETNYTVVIEYWPQRLFYIGAIISVLIGIFCLLTGIKRRVR